MLKFELRKSRLSYDVYIGPIYLGEIDIEHKLFFPESPQGLELSFLKEIVEFMEKLPPGT